MSTMATIVFFIFAIISVAAAWGVVTSKNIVHSALYLALSFFGVAVLYILLNAEFIAAAQILVYAGAVSIMVIFAVMLTVRGDVCVSSSETKKWIWGTGVAGLVFMLIALVILTNENWRVLPTPVTTGGTVELSAMLLTWYMVPFEAAAVLLTIALIGAVILAKGGKERNEH